MVKKLQTFQKLMLMVDLWADAAKPIGILQANERYVALALLALLADVCCLGTCSSFSFPIKAVAGIPL